MGEPKVVGQLGGARNPILITLSEIEGTRIVDIRRYYRDRVTAELKPTSKGLAVTGGNFHELISTLVDCQAEISSWLDGGGDPTAKDAANRRSARVSARTGSRGKTTVEMTEWRSPSFFEVGHEGANSRVSLNKAHAFVKALEQPADSKTAVHLIRDLLWAFDVACTTSATDDAEQLLDRQQLQTAWGMLLGQRLKGTGEGK